MTTALLTLVILVLVLVIIRLAATTRSLRESIPIACEKAVKDFTERSGRVRVGTTVEQLVPFMEEFPYDPSDARLLSGGPVDYVVFDGLSAGKIRELVFLDVKTGKARKSSPQKQVQDCADLGRVRFSIFQVALTGAKAKPSQRVDEVLTSLDEESRKRLRLPE
jgi:predicted Holliday junction resolvase-like endonuclease